MSSDTKTSGSGSGPTSSSEAGKPPNKANPGPADFLTKDADYAKRTNPKDKDYVRALDPTVADKDLTDAEYLTRQGERAKLAIMGAAGGIKSAAFGAFQSGKSALTGGGSAGGSGSGGAAGLADKYNPLHLVEQRPWTSMAASFAAGFVGMMWWHPNRYGRVRKRLGKLEQLFREHDKRVVEVKAVAPAAGAGTKVAAGGISAALVQQAMAAARPFLMEKLAPLIQGMGQSPEDRGRSGNGRPPPDRAADPATAKGPASDRLDPRI